MRCMEVKRVSIAVGALGWISVDDSLWVNSGDYVCKRGGTSGCTQCSMGVEQLG